MKKLNQLSKKDFERVIHALSSLCLPDVVDEKYIRQLCRNGFFYGNDFPYSFPQFCSIVRNEDNFKGIIRGKEMKLFSGIDYEVLKNGGRKEYAFYYVLTRRDFFNISAIEKECGITRTSLTNAMNRKQKSFSNSELLVDFLDSSFAGWDSE